MADTAIFAEHERDFTELAKSLQDRVATVSAGEFSGDAAATLRSIESSVLEANSKLQDMQVSVRGMSAANRRQLGAKVKDYRKLLDGIKADVRRAKDKTDRDALLHGSRGAASYGSHVRLSDESEAHHMRMANATGRAKAGTSMLRDAAATMAEVDDAAAGTADELHRQSAQIDRTRGRIQEVSASVGFAQSILRSMQGRETRFKICIWAFAIFVVILIGVVIYLAFFMDK